jgi:hypothetical protein
MHRGPAVLCFGAGAIARVVDSILICPFPLRTGFAPRRLPCPTILFESRCLDSLGYPFAVRRQSAAQGGSQASQLTASRE